MPYTFVSPNDPIVENCKQVLTCLLSEDVLNRGGFGRQQFTLAPDFPSSNLLVRNPAGETARSLYLTNDLVRAVLSANDYKRIRIMMAGTKIFMRQESGFGRRELGGEDSAESVPRFRLLSEGLPVVLPYIKPDTIIDTDILALRRLLEAYYPLLDAFGEGFQRDVGSRCACAFRSLHNVFPSSDCLATHRIAQGSHIVRFKAGGVDGASCVLPLLSLDPSGYLTRKV